MIVTRRINGHIDRLRPTFCFLPALRFFGLLYPNQVIEDAHEVLVKRPGTSGKRADGKLGELVRCHWSVPITPAMSGL